MFNQPEISQGIHSSSRTEKNSSKSSLPDVVSNWYYKHGLFLSSYPTCATSIAIVVILISCYPLLNIPLPGTIPTKVILPYQKNVGSTMTDQNSLKNSNSNENGHEFNSNNFSLVNNIFNLNNTTNEPPFPWAQSEPFLYVQQIIFRSGVFPWTEDLVLTDAFRAPLHEVFKLLEIVRNHESQTSKITLDHICFHVGNIKPLQEKVIFPEYNCLVLSPANFWGQDIHSFTVDDNILDTIYQYHNLQKTKVSTAEMLFGIPMQHTGFKRYPLRCRARIIQYSITLVLKENNEEYLKSLHQNLINLYPLHQEKKNFTNPSESTESDVNSNENNNSSNRNSVMYIYYPGEFNFIEFMPICTAFVIQFLYVYFSVRKIEAIKSRIILAGSAVTTALSSLMMSLGLCFFFGLTISLQSKGIFPYLIILIGLENSLVITKSVVSTDETFDVKIRFAQGLSKEGWHISKTLLTEITILTVGLATLVPVIQEFCVFTIVGLISDFFLQMLFFSTILAMDIRRTEYTTEAKQIPKMINYAFSDFARRRRNTPSTAPAQSSTVIYSNNVNNKTMTTFSRSHSHPKLSLEDVIRNQKKTDTGRQSISTSVSTGGNDQKIPKRLRVVNFWTRTRFFQRAFMLWMSVWIFSIAYNSDFIVSFFITESSSNMNVFPRENLNNKENSIHSKMKAKQFLNTDQNLKSANSESNNYAQKEEFLNNEQDTDESGIKKSKKNDKLEEKLPIEVNNDEDNSTNYIKKLEYPDFEIGYFLSNFHWSSILRQYNISLSGKYVTILPAIKLSHIIKPEEAIYLRNPKEKIVKNFQWKALAAALDPIDFNEDEIRKSAITPPGGTPLYPKSPMEIFLATVLCMISVCVLTYAMVIFYRCICSRNYAEWRSSWAESEMTSGTEQILETIPIKVPGHKHKIECLISDGMSVVSTCLEGKIKVWDSKNGELISDINRGKLLAEYVENNYSLKMENDENIDYQYHEINFGAARSEKRHEEQAILLRKNDSSLAPIWCMDYLDNLIAVGCANGKLEFWEAPTGILKCTNVESLKYNNGATHISLSGDRVVVARLCGRLDFYRLETYCKGQQIDWNFTSAYRRTHVRAGSTGSIATSSRDQLHKMTKEEMKCHLVEIKLAHQQPITCMEVVNGIVFTGSQDHTLKIYNFEDVSSELTLHGHCGPITCLFIDHWQHGTGGSGSQDGMLCVWDIFTGACMYNIQAHDGAINALICAPSYVISLGIDERVCVWERFQGNLLATINITNPYSNLLMLTPSLLVTSKQGSIVVWDVRTGELTKEVKLNGMNTQFCPKHMILASSSVICDYGNQLRIVRFPMVADKCN